MAQTLEELVSKWTIETDLTPLETARKGLEGLAVSMGAIAATVSAAAATLFGIAKATAEAGEEASKAAAKFGITAAAYQELQYAARGEAGELSQGLLFLNKNMEAASSGAKEAAKAFANMGVNLYQNGMPRNSDDVLMDIADRFKSMPADARRTAAAVDIFGRSGAGLIPFLVQGRDAISELRQEAQDFGFVIQDTDAADKFNDVLDDLGNIFRGLRNTIGVELMPVITELMDGFKEWIALNRQIIVENLRYYVQVLGRWIKIMTTFMVQMFKALSGLVRLFGGWRVVITTLIIGMGAFLALLAAWSIGALVAGIYGIVTGFTALAAALNVTTFALLKTYAAFLAPFAVIGAAIIGVLLVVEDLFTYFSGEGESVFGDFVDTIKGVFMALEEGFNGMSTWSKGIITFLLTPLRAVIETLRSVWSLVQMITGQKSLADTAKQIVGGFASVMGFDLKGGAIGKTLSGAIGLNNSGNIGEGVGMVPGFAPAVGANDNSKSMNQSTTINQTINAGEGASALETGKAVAGQTENALNRRNRQAARTFSAQGAY